MLQNKIEIYSIHYNRPDFIELQLKSFRKFIKTEFEFIVIDNSIIKEISEEIKSICEKMNIKYLLSKNNIPHGPMHYGWSHIHGMNFFKEQLIKSNSKYVFLMEHDIFFCSDYTRLEEIVKKYGVSGLQQNRKHINYFHPGILLFNKELTGDLSEFDFRGDIVENEVLNKDLDGVRVDTGGQTHKWIKNHPDNICFIDDFVNKYLEEVNSNHIFYHMVRGSNWIGTEDELNRKKIEIIQNFVQESL